MIRISINNNNNIYNNNIDLARAKSEFEALVHAF